MSRIDVLRQRIVERLQRFGDSREPRHEIIWGLLGDVSGTVSVPNQAGKVYCRLLGIDSNLVRAWNATAPLVATLRVDVEVERQEGMPDDYTVLGVSRIAYIGYADDSRFYVPPHHESHEYQPGGGYDIVNVYTRSLAELRADAQATPDMTLRVSAGFYITTSALVYFTGVNSPTFSAAPGAGRRYDLLYLDVTTNVLEIREGTAAPIGVASRPNPQLDELPIAWVEIDAGDTEITDSMIFDARAYLMSLGGVSVTRDHVLDPESGPHTGTIPGLHAHADNEDKSGECDGAKTVFLTAQEFPPEYLQVYLNGQLLTLNDDYTEGAFYDSFTMTVAPIVGDALILSYVAQWA